MRREWRSERWTEWETFSGISPARAGDHRRRRGGSGDEVWGKETKRQGGFAI